MNIAITPGEPAGIGPDLVVQLSNKFKYSKDTVIIIADQDLLHQRTKLLGLSPFTPNNQMQILHVPLSAPVIPGQLNPKNAEYVLNALQLGCDGCLQGQFDALVTGPVHKGVLNQAGIAFTGHTEWLAKRCGGNPVMMLVTEELRVALATTHVPLSEVSKLITRDKLEQIIRILHQDLQRCFGIASPRIAICGLNPHAGESGYLGHEEIDVISPVIKILQNEGLNLIGPVSADSWFVPKNMQHFDAVLTMYHDQGLPVLKHIGFGRSANVTLGLPIIRVSVDHGTALNLASTGQANTGSLLYAIETAQQLCHHEHSFRKNCS
jgi:4-hydroxythreonine-4-phosphate dehydrogenase